MSDTAQKKILEKVKNSSFYKQIEEDEKNELLKGRTEAVRKIDLLERESANIVKKLQQTLQERETELKRVQDNLHSVTQEYREVKTALWNESFRAQRGINQQKNILLDSYDPVIDDALIFYRDKLDWLRNPSRISTSPQGAELNPVTLKKKCFGRTNYYAIGEALVYCQQAIKLLEKLKLLPSLDVRVIEELKAGIPDIEVYTDITSEKETGKGLSTSALLKIGEGTRNYTLKKLIEKVDKHLGQPSYA